MGIGRGTSSIHDPPLEVFLDPPLNENADFFSKMKGEQDAASFLPTKRGPLPPTASVV